MGRRRRFRRRKAITIKDHRDFIDQCKTKHTDKYKYTKTKYTDDNQKVTIRCRLHGYFTIKPKRVLIRKGGCPKCRRVSNGEIRTALFLIDNKIKYIPEYKLPDHQWRYDFYLPLLGILIEYDGVQHYKPVRKFGGNKQYKAIVQRDHDKDLLATEHGLKVIRVPYTAYDNLYDYLLTELSKIYQYKVKNRYYIDFKELKEALKLPGNTKRKDVEQYLVKP